MATTKILAGSPVRQDETVLKYHLSSLRQQELPPNVEMDFLFVDDSDEHDLAGLVTTYAPQCIILEGDERPPDSSYSVGAQTHHWNEPTLDHLAKQRQRILDYAVEHDYDWIFLCDTDLLIEPRTIKSLLSTRKPLVSAVFWTNWQKGDPRSLGPNVWLRNPYHQDGLGMAHHEFWKRLVERKITRVYGGGACHLIQTPLVEKGIHYYPRLPGLPREGMWQGEDRTFAILAFQLHEMQWADPWPYIYHAYHPEMRTEEALSSALKTLLAESSKYAKEGDLISFTLQHLEEPKLKDQSFSIRGRLGGLTLAPEIEKTLMEMPVGEEAFVEVSFPFWWPQLRGQTRTLKLEFIDSRPYGFPPILADHAFKGLQ